MRKLQFNVEILPADAIRAKTDAVRLGVSLGAYTTAALRLLRSVSREDLRRKFKGQRKQAGRKVTL